MSQKSRTTAGILAILLGGLGAHKFYMGKIGLGILYLIFVWTFIPSIVGLIEGIIYLTMTDEAWQAKYFGGATGSQAAQRMCVKCGMQIDPSFRACPHCGNIVPTVPPTPPPPPPT
jgi:TM2 domain-containing membrane protein YozV